MHHHRFPTLLSDQLHKRLKELYQKRTLALEKIKTKAQALQHKNNIQKKIRKCFGAFPKKTKLHVITTKKLTYTTHAIECLKFESKPGFWVSANLYIPNKKNHKSPGIVFPCGHSKFGKAAPLYKEACLHLVKEGYVVIIYDPINQGERKIYSLKNYSKENPDYFNATIGHNHIGKQMRSCGQDLCNWMVWEGKQCLDYLYTRPEVDTSKIGVTGNSGGGALSAYLWALDKRFTMVASSCWATSYLNDLENEMPGDNEQYPRGFLAEGLDKIDLFMARAGEPTLLLGQERDFFDDRGLKKGYLELLRIHKLIGGNINTCKLHMDTVKHSYSPTNQKEMVKFFHNIIGFKKPNLKPLQTIPTENDLHVSPSGDLHKSGSKPMYDLVSNLAKEIGAKRKKASKDLLVKKICQSLCIKIPKHTPNHRRTHGEGRWVGKIIKKNTYIFRFLVETEPNIFCPLRHIAKTTSAFRLDPQIEVELVIPNICSQTEFEKGLIKSKHDLWVLDVRGLGEGLIVPDDLSNHYGMDYLHAGHALMFRETLLGKRVFDILATINLLFSEGVQKIHLQGIGQGAVIATIAAILDKRVSSIKSIRAPESFQKLASATRCYWPDALFPFNVLASFDLPEIRRALGKKYAQNGCASTLGKEFQKSKK